MSDPEGWFRDRRRLLVLLLVVVLALAGAGIGSFVFDDDDDQPGVQTPTANETVNVSLVADSNTRLLNASNITPNSDGSRTVVLRNSGADPGTLTIAETALTQRENGLAGPEVEVDNSTDSGELAEHLLVRLQFQTTNGTTVALYGTGDGPRPLSDVVGENSSRAVSLDPGNQTRLQFEWVLPEDTGNVVQSDSLTLNATFQLWGNQTTPK